MRIIDLWRWRAGLGCIVVAAAVAGGGCSSPQTRTWAEPSFDFADVRTYGWAAGASGTSGVLAGNRAALEQAARESINRELGARGWVMVDPVSADVQVRYLIGARDEAEVLETGVGMVAGERVEVPVHVKHVRAGELAIDLIDPAGTIIVWRGAARVTRERPMTPDEARAAVKQAVGRLLGEVPGR